MGIVRGTKVRSHREQSSRFSGNAPKRLLYVEPLRRAHARAARGK